MDAGLVKDDRVDRVGRGNRRLWKLVKQARGVRLDFAGKQHKKVLKRVGPRLGSNGIIHFKFSVGCVATPTGAHPAALVKLAGGVIAPAMA